MSFTKKKLLLTKMSFAITNVANYYISIYHVKQKIGHYQ
jgi:hypothetical protein